MKILPGRTSIRTLAALQPIQFSSSRTTPNSRSSGPLPLLVYLVAFVVLLLTASSPGQAQTPPTTARPILFVHGFCDDVNGWSPLQDAIINGVRAQPNIGSLYQDYIQPVYYDGQSVKLWPGGQDFATLTPTWTRFFSIEFFDPFGNDNAAEVAQVSILNKADELAQVIRAIAALTRVKDVILIGHSMGGLDARAYLEGFAIPWLQWPCTDNYACLSSTRTPYAQDIAKLITIDTPHSGAEVDNWTSWIQLGALGCFAEDTLNKEELKEGSYVIGTLLNPGLLNSSIAQAISDVPITAIQNYTIPGLFPGDSGDDGVVTTTEQSIATIPHSEPHYLDIADDVGSLTNISSDGCYVLAGTFPLHLLSCLGLISTLPPLITNALDVGTLAAPTSSIASVTANATLNGNPWTGSLSYSISGNPNNAEPFNILGTSVSYTFYNGTGYYTVPPGAYTISVSSGPTSTFTISPANTQYLGVNPITGVNTWNLTFTIAFTSTASSPPIVDTLPATNVDGGDGTLQGTVNPNGASTSAWFEWSTDAGLTNPKSTPTQSGGAGATPASITSALTGLDPNTTYYYRIAALGAGGNVQRGVTLQFTTLTTLPAPTLLAPANGSTGVSVTPTFSWSPVSGASSGYRIMIAPSRSDLPSDPTVPTCAGCVWNDEPQATSDTPLPGVLVPSTTYYWQVHARSPSQFGAWSTIFSFTTSTTSSANDFSVQASPATLTTNPSGTATYLVTTATTAGSPQNITLSVGNLPNGVTSAVFSPASLTSGTPSTLTVTLGSTVPIGTYALTIVGIGSAATHSTQVSLTVAAPAAGPAVTLMPSSQSFPSEAVGTSSPPQTAAFRNSGGSLLTITGLSVSAGSDYGYILPSNQGFPLPWNQNEIFSFQVYFLPSATGPRTGQIYIWDDAPDSPQVMSFTGNGLPAAPSTGTIQILGTLNNSPLPSSYGFSYTLTGPSTYTGGGAYTFNVTPGSYTLSSNTCCGLTLSNITPSPTQSVTAGGQITFTLNFTASNDFFGPYFGLPQGNTSTQIVPVGGTATYYPVVDYSYSVGGVYHSNPATPIALQVLGLPVGAAPSFDPQQSYGDSTLTVTTSAATPPGLYTLSLTGTNTSGLVRAGTNTAALVVTGPPSPPVQRVSVSSNGTQGNAQSPGGSVSADGRYVAFLSYATDLTSDANNDGSVYVRDLQAGTTTFASLDANGNPFGSVFEPLINATGRDIVFGADGPLGLAVYLRDLQLNKTERDDVASDGTLGNGSWSIPMGISADGRFVSFDSNATNLVTGANDGTQQCYVRDREAGTTTLVSVGNDGNPANAGCSFGAISADGRYIAFASSATNLVPLNLNGYTQIFVRDMQVGETEVASVASDGTSANAGINTNSLPVLSADGRFVVFGSLSTNLSAEAGDGNIHLFLRDRQLKVTSVVDADSNGALSGGPGSGASPSISADGRFVSYVAYNQAFVRDMTNNQSLALSLAADGTAGNGNSTTPAISPGGSVISFASASSNLVNGDTNDAPDTFVASNPFLGAPYVQTLTMSSSSVGGGSAMTGTVTLSAVAPTGGASVTIWANNSAADAPAIAFVPEGATAGTFTIGTSVVSTETVITIIAAYNGGSAVALLTVEPSPVVVVSPPAWDFGSQTAGTASAPQSFTIQNAGTAPLSLSSLTLASGQIFHISSNQCSGSINTGNSCAFSVVFNPSQAGMASSDTLQISYGNPATVQTVSLNGYTPQAISPNLGLALQHTGDFAQGQEGAQYTVAVSNAPGAGPTSGTVTVTETVPAGLTLALMSGTGWTCPGTAANNCTRSDVLNGGASYPVITVTVNVASNAPSTVTNEVTISGGGTPASASDLTAIAASTSGNPLQFVPVAPCRVMDTRNPNGPLAGPYIARGTARAIPVPSSACGVPANALAYSLNLTVVPRSGTLGYLSVWPTGQPQPLVSTLNSADGSVLANAAIVPAGTGGEIDAYASNDTELVVDINGYYVPPATGTLQFYPLTPCRILDTRNPNGTFGGPSLAGGSSRSFPVSSSTCGAPVNAAAYSLNVTAVPHGLLGYLTAWPTGQSQPLVSTLNSLDGTVLANAAIVPAGTDGAVSFFAANTTDLVVDINGYFAPPGTGGLNFYAVTPCRVVDTRNATGALGGPILSGGATRTFPLAGSCGLPSNTKAYSLNMTVVPSGFLGYLSNWPTGGTQPAVSTLNAYKGQVVANASMVPSGTAGSINVFVTNTTHVIVDANGYFGQ